MSELAYILKKKRDEEYRARTSTISLDIDIEITEENENDDTIEIPDVEEIEDDEFLPGTPIDEHLREPNPHPQYLLSNEHLTNINPHPQYLLKSESMKTYQFEFKKVSGLSINHGLNRIPFVAIWRKNGEETTQFGKAPFGTAYFGGTQGIELIYPKVQLNDLNNIFIEFDQITSGWGVISG